MLLELKVSNFAIIDNLHIQFKDGLNILSGETGSGKSVLLKSLALLMGAKSSTDTIRTGAQQAVVEGSFDLSKRKDLMDRMSEMGIDVEDHLLVVRRVISGGDKSRVYLNGGLSTLNALRDIVAPLIEVTGHAAPLIEMTGQHENRHLMSKAYHLDLLDQYVGAWDRRLKYEEKYKRHAELKYEIESLEQSSKQKAQRLDFLTYQRDEITALDLNPGEDVSIEQELKVLKNSARINQFVDQAEEALYSDDESAMSRINSVLKRAVELSALDPLLAKHSEQLNEAKTIIDDTVYSLRQYASKIEGDPQRLDFLENRLSDLRKLQKKYGSSIDDILKSLLEMEIEISTLQNSEVRSEELKKN